jgi:NADH-quinone oxidoreductase subunit H
MITELSIYGIIFSGWASNSRFPFLGSLRSTAQLISYSVSLSLILLTVIFLLGTLDLFDLLDAQRHISLFIPLFPLAI